MNALEYAARQALPPEAKALLAEGLDAADAWLAMMEGKTPRQAKSANRRARGSNVVRDGWAQGEKARGEDGLVGVDLDDPCAMLEAAQLVSGLLGSRQQDLVNADVAGEIVDTHALAQALGCTVRKVQLGQKFLRELRGAGQQELDLLGGAGRVPKSGKPRRLYKPRRNWRQMQRGLFDDGREL